MQPAPHLAAIDFPARKPVAAMVPCFTVAELAQPLGKLPQALRKSLSSVASDTAKIVQGKVVAAWFEHSLPLGLRAALDAVREKCGARSLFELVSLPPAIWQPRDPKGRVIHKDEMRPEDIQSASRLQRVFRPDLEGNYAHLTSAEREARGVAAYKAEYLKDVTPRWYREQRARFIERDGGAGNFDRLEIFLPERLARKNAPKLRTVASNPEFSDLAEYLTICRNPPNTQEMEELWTRVYDHFERLKSVLPVKRAKRKLRDAVSILAPFQRTKRATLSTQFNRKMQQIEADGPKKNDRRSANGDKWKLPEEDYDRISIKAAIFYRGEIAPAWYELLLARQLSPSTLDRYAEKAKSKYHVPKKVRRTLGDWPRLLYLLHYRKKDFQRELAYMRLAYDGIKTLDGIMADDVTLPLKFYVPDGDGFKLVLGQCLILLR